jgi:hypothetical protein
VVVPGGVVAKALVSAQAAASRQNRYFFMAYLIKVRVCRF